MRKTAEHSVIRSIVIRPLDGRLIKVVAKQGQLFVCKLGCCCSDTQKGYPPVPMQHYQDEWERRKLRNRVHLSETACLGPCQLANVALLVFDGRATWFHSINSPTQVEAIFDWIELLLKSETYESPPPALTDYIFDGFNWTNSEAGLLKEAV
jgi:cobaltochelatase CobN